jgi:hypothetical protein
VFEPGSETFISFTAQQIEGLAVRVSHEPVHAEGRIQSAFLRKGVVMDSVMIIRIVAGVLFCCRDGYSHSAPPRAGQVAGNSLALQSYREGAQTTLACGPETSPLKRRVCPSPFRLTNESILLL